MVEQEEMGLSRNQPCGAGPAVHAGPDQSSSNGVLEYRFFSGPWENSELPSICRDDPHGGDWHILGVFKRVHNPDQLWELCRLANEVLRAGPAPQDTTPSLPPAHSAVREMNAAIITGEDLHQALLQAGFNLNPWPLSPANLISRYEKAAELLTNVTSEQLGHAAPVHQPFREDQ